MAAVARRTALQRGERGKREKSECSIGERTGVNSHLPPGVVNFAPILKHGK